MTDNRPRGLFFCGTGTEVGKTYVASAMAAALHRRKPTVGVYKPVASGCIDRGEGRLESEDADSLAAAIDGRLPRELVCPQKFRAPLAPPTAAAQEGRLVDEALLVDGFDTVAAKSEFVIVEGAGGLMSPLSESMTNLDLAMRLGLPVAVVAGNRLGVLNDCLLCWTVLTRCTDLSLHAFVLSSVTARHDDSHASNAADLQKWLPDATIVEVPHGGKLDQIDVDRIRNVSK